MGQQPPEEFAQNAVSPSVNEAEDPPSRIAPLADPTQRVIGTVKWWNNEKGFGFLSRADGPDAFVHFTFIDEANEEHALGGGFKDLVEGERVEFQIESNPRGESARRIRRIDRFPSDTIQDEGVDSEPRLDESFVAIALFGGRLRLVEIDADGHVQVLDPHSGLHSLLYVASQEAVALADATAELEELLNSDDTRELDFQRFFERHLEFITGDDYVAAHPHVVLTAQDGHQLIPDFMLEPVGRGQLCDLLELKLPSAPVIVGQPGRTRLSAAVAAAHAQLRQYRDHFNEERHRDALRHEYGLEAFYPAMYVLIGRRGSVSPLDFRRSEEAAPGLRLLTYDDVLDRVHRRLERRRLR
jgi:CspA family cold shock protein